VGAVYQRMPAALAPHRAPISSRFGQALFTMDITDFEGIGGGVAPRPWQLNFSIGAPRLTINKIDYRPRSTDSPPPRPPN
jgi:hypothetical protein